jgi:hypothetical protein
MISWVWPCPSYSSPAFHVAICIKLNEKQLQILLLSKVLQENASFSDQFKWDSTVPYKRVFTSNLEFLCFTDPEITVLHYLAIGWESEPNTK